MKSPIQSVPVQRGLNKAVQMNGIVQSGCNWFRCAGAVATCAAACIAGPGSPACIACLGPAYDSCKDCV
jgi:hypothetical protein